VTHQRFWTALAFCVLSTLPLVSPARAEHAYAMVCCSVPSSVSVIATATHKTAATLVAGLGSSSAALTADGGTVYVANQNAQSISVLDTATGSAITTISLSAYGASPYGVVLSPDGTRLYVAAVQNGGISVLGITTASYSALFDVATPGAAEGNLTPIPVPPPVISSDGQTVYLLAGSLIAFNTNTFASATLSFNPGSSHPQGVALTPDNAYALVTFNEGRAFSDNSGQFALVDLSTFTVVQQISFPESVTVGAVVGSPDGSLAYFPANSSGKVAVEVFDIASGAVVDTFPAGAGGGSPIAITPDGSEIELGVANEVLSINASTGALIARTGTPGEMVSLTVSADGTAIYVPNFNSSMLEIVDPATSQITGQIPSGWTGAVYDTSYTMQVSAGGRRAAVMGAGSLSIVNTETPALIGVLPIAGTFVSVAISPNGNQAYALIGAPSGGVAQIQIIDTAAVKIIGAISLTSADRPSQAVVSSNGETLYVDENYCPTGESCVPQLLTIDIAAMTVISHIPLGASGPAPGNIVLSANGDFAYVVSLEYSQSSIITVDLAQGLLISTIPVGWGGFPIALAPNQKELYELATSNYFFYIVDLPSQQVTGVPDSVGVYWGYAAAMALSPDGKYLYLTSETDPYIVAFSMSGGTPTFLTTIDLPSATNGVGFSKY
jgi:YVTN family beta-propeller protein